MKYRCLEIVMLAVLAGLSLPAAAGPRVPDNGEPPGGGQEWKQERHAPRMQGDAASQESARRMRNLRLKEAAPNGDQGHGGSQEWQGAPVDGKPGRLGPKPEKGQRHFWRDKRQKGVDPFAPEN
ncbi:hypothetical protein [uncultured Aquitalea sp.]|uniref:hypothetical protein n=1 Tax=uncultured Aquitalea sp. TaxID=540272 RepID=UPI0025D35271|nr:hypothetical protein [uncultured Aquitalea sp.]